MRRRTTPQNKMQKAMRSHPRVTLATIATVAGILVAVAPAILWAVHYFETHADAEIAYAKQQQALSLHKVTVARLMAWSAVADARRDTVVARNRVNDCAVMKEQKHGVFSPLERGVCQQYQEEWEAAVRRFDEAQRAAQQASKGE